MIKKYMIATFLFLTFISLNLYAAEESSFIKPKYEIEKIIQDSKEFALAYKEELNNYYIDYVKYEAADRRWVVHFQGYLLAVGNDFMVLFNETTDKMKLIRGQ